jgi:hypothetical protein
MMAVMGQTPEKSRPLLGEERKAGKKGNVKSAFARAEAESQARPRFLAG